MEQGKGGLKGQTFHKLNNKQYDYLQGKEFGCASVSKVRVKSRGNYSNKDHIIICI